MQSVKNAAMARSVPHAIEFLLLRHGKKYDRNNKVGESVSFRSNVHRAAAAMRFWILHEIRSFGGRSLATELINGLCHGEPEGSLHLSSRDNVFDGNDAPKQVVRVVFHPGQGHIRSSRAARTIQPQGDVVELRALVLVNRSCVAQPQREVHHTIYRHFSICILVDGEQEAGVCSYQDTSSLQIDSLHDSAHAVDEMMLFVKVFGEHDAETAIEWDLCRNGCTIGAEFSTLSMVVLVVLIVPGTCARSRCLRFRINTWTVWSLMMAAPRLVQVMRVVRFCVLANTSSMPTAVGAWCPDQALCPRQMSVCRNRMPASPSSLLMRNSTTSWRQKARERNNK